MPSVSQSLAKYLSGIHRQQSHNAWRTAVNNAAISPKNASGGRLTIGETDLGTWQSVFQVNFFSPVLLAQGLVDDLKASGRGAIVNVTSIVGSRVHREYATAACRDTRVAAGCQIID